LIKNILNISFKVLFRDKLNFLAFLIAYILFWYYTNFVYVNDYRAGGMLVFLFWVNYFSNEMLFSFNSNQKYGKKYKVRVVNSIIPVSRKEVIYQKYIFIFLIIVLSAVLEMIINNYLLGGYIESYTFSYFSISLFLITILGIFNLASNQFIKNKDLVYLKILILFIYIMFGLISISVLNIFLVNITLPFLVNIFLLSISVLSVYIFAKINYLISMKVSIE
jgi:hypothetical protein